MRRTLVVTLLQTSSIPAAPVGIAEREASSVYVRVAAASVYSLSHSLSVSRLGFGGCREQLSLDAAQSRHGYERRSGWIS